MPVCSWLFEHTENITMHVVPRKHFFKIFLQFWSGCFRIARKSWRNVSLLLVVISELTNFVMTMFPHRSRVNVTIQKRNNIVVIWKAFFYRVQSILYFRTGRDNVVLECFFWHCHGLDTAVSSNFNVRTNLTNFRFLDKNSWIEADQLKYSQVFKITAEWIFYILVKLDHFWSSCPQFISII